MLEGREVLPDSLLMYKAPTGERDAVGLHVREWCMVRADEMRPFQPTAPMTHQAWITRRKGRVTLYRWPNLRELTEYYASKEHHD